LCAVGKQTQTPHWWCVGEKPPFALYGHRYKEKDTGAKRTYNVKASNEVCVVYLYLFINRNVHTLFIH